MAINDASQKIKALDNLRRKMSSAPLPLKESAQHLVFGEGSVHPAAFLIGEAPGASEDKKGLPFVGAAGRELDGLLSLAGLTRQDVYITSILKYRPPGNRPPALVEIKAHVPFLVDQIRIIQPALIVPMGNFATRFVLSGFDTARMDAVEGITRIHGRAQALQAGGMTFTILPVYHPAAALYKRPLRKVLEEDFRKIPSVGNSAGL